MTNELYSTRPNSKKPWQSKTLIANLILAVLAFFPAVKDHVTAEQLGMIFAIVNAGLRLVTKDKISLNA